MKKRKTDDDATDSTVPRKEGRERRVRERESGRPHVRAKPGAALANAKRETVGIVPSQGKKIVF